MSVCVPSSVWEPGAQAGHSGSPLAGWYRPAPHGAHHRSRVFFAEVAHKDTETFMKKLCEMREVLRKIRAGRGCECRRALMVDGAERCAGCLLKKCLVP